MYFEEHKAGILSVPKAFFLELKEKAKKYDDLLDAQQELPKKEIQEGDK